MSLETYKQIIPEDFTMDADFIDQMIKQLGLAENARILDIGTGLGAMSILLALNGYHVLTGQPEEDLEWDECQTHHSGHHGLEAEQLHHHGDQGFDWRDNARALGVEEMITFRYLNAESLDFPDGSFDGIFLYDSLQHIGVMLQLELEKRLL